MTNRSVSFTDATDASPVTILSPPAASGAIIQVPDNENWLPSCLPSNPEQENDFVERLRPLILRIVRRHLPRRETEEDMVQSVYLRIWQKFHQYSGAVPLTHWVSRVAVNTCLNQISREKCRLETRQADINNEDFDCLAEIPDDRLENPAEEISSGEQVDSLLARLSPEDRTILYLRHVEHYSVQQVSEMTGLNEGVVKIRSLRARRKLQKRLVRNGQRTA